MDEIADIHWVAGWLEGEGCFTPASANGSQPTGYPRITGSSTDEDIITEVARILGTSVRGPYYYKGKLDDPLKALWRVNLHGQDAFTWMKKLLPYMRGSRRRRKMEEQINLFSSRYA